MVGDAFPAITVAYGDGIGPEIMEAVLRILKDAGAKITIETIEVGQRIYEGGESSGIPDDAWEQIARNKILLKAPITTPQGGGYKSLNVTLRRRLGLYANIRPCKSYAPFVQTKHPDMDLIVVRENEEGLYAGIEHRPTRNAFESLKLLTHSGSEKISRYAFELARAHGRKKVTCLTKDNILKISDGQFHRAFDLIAKEYQDIENEHYIVDIGTARLASSPENFDVVVTENLYGDIISDIVAETSGSVGLAGSANIGEEFAMFEAVHGSAPDIAGKGIANPSGLLNAAVMLLVHIGQPEVASKIQNAWLKTIEDGMHTGDIYHKEVSKVKLGTEDFATAVIERLGETPATLPAVSYTAPDQSIADYPVTGLNEEKALVGADIFFDWQAGTSEALAERLQSACANTTLQLQFIDSRGLMVWPGSSFKVSGGDYWRGRFVAAGDEKLIQHQDIVALLAALAGAEFDFAKVVSLYTYDGQLGFSLAQGQ